MKHLLAFLVLFSAPHAAHGATHQEDNQAESDTEAPPIKKKIPSEIRRNMPSIEAGGPGVIYAVKYDIKISDEWRVGIGASYIGYADLLVFSVADYRALFTYVNYYPFSKPRFFFTAGLGYYDGKIGPGSLTYAFASAFVNSVSGDSSDPGPTPRPTDPFHVLLGNIGAGYEFLARNGFFFRATLYGIFNNQGIVPTPSFSVGWSF